MKIRSLIQYDDFDITEQYEHLATFCKYTGSVVTFSGLVRELDKSCESSTIDYMYLEHYPQMTEMLLKKIIDRAMLRFNLLAVTVIHRIGKLKPNDHIVFVGVASEHRSDGFQSIQFIMDYLKTQATIWKKISYNGDCYWVDSKKADLRAAKCWREVL